MATADPMPADDTRYLRLSEFQPQLRISRPTIYRMVKDGTFPKPVKFGHSSLWIESEVKEWEQVRVANR